MSEWNNQSEGVHRAAPAVVLCESLARGTRRECSAASGGARERIVNSALRNVCGAVIVVIGGGGADSSVDKFIHRGP
jgi:hypothetical protein